MAIDEQFLECVVSLCVDNDRDDESAIAERLPVAVASVVSMTEADLGVDFSYVVTANHVVQRGRECGALFIRFNLQDGITYDMPSDPNKDWITHPDPRVDIAVHPLSEIPDSAKLMPIPMDSLVTDQFVKAHAINVGDTLLSVGLFQPHIGHSSSKPIVRFGNIYLMPQFVATRLLRPNSTRVDIMAYLAEWRSWGGAMGSPVFLYPGRDTRSGSLGEDKIRLLGLVHSHVNIENTLEFTGEVLITGMLDVDYGISLIVPAQRIRDLLMTEELIRTRKEAVDKLMIDKLVTDRQEAIEKIRRGRAGLVSAGARTFSVSDS